MSRRKKKSSRHRAAHSRPRKKSSKISPLLKGMLDAARAEGLGMMPFDRIILEQSFAETYFNSAEVKGSALVNYLDSLSSPVLQTPDGGKRMFEVY